MTRIALAFARSTATPDAQLCSACVDVLNVAGAGITVMAGDQTGPLCASNARMSALEDLQFTTGVGPCRDAFLTRDPVLATQMDTVASGRWPAFVDLAIASGIGAVFAYPLSFHRVTIGVLTLYQDAPGSLTGTQHDDSIAVSELLTETLLSLLATVPEGELTSSFEDAIAYRAEVHQASGMIAVQLQVSTADALVRIRAHAFANDVSVAAVAAEIVARRLRLTDDRDPPRGGV